MSFDDLATYLDDIKERADCEATLDELRRIFGADSDRARGVYEDEAVAQTQGA